MRSKNFFIILFLFCFAICSSHYSFAHHESSNSEIEVSNENEDLNNFLDSLKDLQITLKKQKNKQARITYRKIRAIARGIDKALDAEEPQSCLDILEISMEDFFSLEDDLGIGISCGPAILPPFLPGTDVVDEPIIPDCLPPPDEEMFRGFFDAFSEVYGVYNEARDVFGADVDSSNIPDACE